MPTQIVYPEDLTGLLPSNLIPSENKTLNQTEYLRYSLIVPDAAPFYATGLVVTHFPSGRVMQRGVDFELTHKFFAACVSTTKEVFGSITFFGTGLTGYVNLQYQTVGGNWVVNNSQALAALYNSLLDPAVAYWDQVVLYPALFPPAPHDLSTADTTSYEDAVNALHGIESAIRDKTAAMVSGGGSGSGGTAWATLDDLINGTATLKAVKPDILAAWYQYQLTQDTSKSKASFTALVNSNQALMNELLPGQWAFIGGTYGRMAQQTYLPHTTANSEMFNNDYYTESFKVTVLNSTQVNVAKGMGLADGLLITLNQDVTVNGADTGGLLVLVATKSTDPTNPDPVITFVWTDTDLSILNMQQYKSLFGYLVLANVNTAANPPVNDYRNRLNKNTGLIGLSEKLTPINQDNSYTNAGQSYWVDVNINNIYLPDTTNIPLLSKIHFKFSTGYIDNEPPLPTINVFNSLSETISVVKFSQTGVDQLKIGTAILIDTIAAIDFTWTGQTWEMS